MPFRLTISKRNLRMRQWAFMKSDVNIALLLGILLPTVTSAQQANQTATPDSATKTIQEKYAAEYQRLAQQDQATPETSPEGEEKQKPIAEADFHSTGSHKDSFDVPEFRMETQHLAFDLPTVTMKTRRVVWGNPEV